MLQAALRAARRSRRAVFEVFARRLPDGRRYGVVAGTGAAARRDRRTSASTTTSWRFLRDAGVVDDGDR